MMIATTTARSQLRLSGYGLEIAVESDWTDVVDAVQLDFAWFESTDDAGPPDVRILVERRTPDYDAHPDAVSAFVTPRNVVYQEPGRTIVDYFGRALSVRDAAGRTIEVQGDDFAVVHEAVYQFILSRLGEHLDRIGMPRLHGLGLVGKQGGVVVMLPSGGGKTTLALRALREKGVRLLSDDSPVLDRQGRLHPFPLRFGLNETDAAKLPPGHVRRIERMEFHPKLALEVHAFADRIASEPSPLRHLVIGRRSLGKTGGLQPLPRRSAVAPLLREVVIGVGLYQGMEFILQRGLRDVLRKGNVAATRAVRCARGLTQANVWLLTLGYEHESNWAALRSLLE